MRSLIYNHLFSDSSYIETMNCVDHHKAELEISQKTPSARLEVGHSQETIPYTDDMAHGIANKVESF